MDFKGHTKQNSAMGSAWHSQAQDLFILAVLLFVASWALGPILHYHGHEAHRYITQSIGAESDLADCFLKPYVSYAPSYRPLAKLYYKLQYTWFGIDVYPYYHMNLVIWVLAGFLVYRILVTLTGSAWVGSVMALLFITCFRLEQFHWITSSHNAWANATGLLALYLIVGCRTPYPSIARHGAILALLLASPLFKEYGLAFAVGAFFAVLLRPRLDWKRSAITGILPVALYFALRFIFAQGTTVNFDVTYGGFSATQSLGNIWNSLLDIVIHAMHRLGGKPYTEEGELARTLLYRPPLTLLVPFVILGLTGWACWRNFRIACPYLITILSCAFLNFFAFRTRNLMVGTACVLILAGLGLQDLRAGVTAMRIRKAIALGLGAICLAGACLSYQLLRRGHAVYSMTKILSVQYARERFPRDVSPTVQNLVEAEQSYRKIFPASL